MICSICSPQASGQAVFREPPEAPCPKPISNSSTRIQHKDLGLRKCIICPSINQNTNYSTPLSSLPTILFIICFSQLSRNNLFLCYFLLISSCLFRFSSDIPMFRSLNTTEEYLVSEQFPLNFLAYFLSISPPRPKHTFTLILINGLFHLACTRRFHF